MKLSIITINRNNAEGLRKTMKSVLGQHLSADSACTSPKASGVQIEYIIVDGASTDGSVEVIKELVSSLPSGDGRIKVTWLSEPDSGIYNAMNKGIDIACGRRVVNAFNRSELVEDKNNGIRRATSDYIEILNSGDMLYDDDVVAKMTTELERLNALAQAEGRHEVDILYGNMIKFWPDGRRYEDRCGAGGLTMLSFYHGTLNHNPAYIRCELFDRFGLYDESLKIVSDWKWYLQVIPLGGITPVYVDINVTLFDMTGVSESNTAYWPLERRPVLEELVPPLILADYDRYAADMRMMDRLRKHHMHGPVRFLERVLFKLEKWGILHG